MAIEQHPIPQDVAGYKFRLIGDMTLKQFIWLAGGIITGLIIYSLPLPFFFKYPLAIIGVLLGAGIAFVPIEGRSLDKWLIAFIRSVYSPTQFVWKKDDGQGPSPIPSVTKSLVSIATSRGIAPVEPAKPELSIVTPPVVATNSRSPVQRDEDPSVVPLLSGTKGGPPQSPTPAVTPPQPQISNTPALPIPFTPTTGNTLVGMTLTPDGKILDGCLIEITANGLSLRATKSNQLGQFLFAKPLENGLYQILTEKLGYQFETYSLNLTGQIIKPLRLQAKSQS